MSFGHIYLVYFVVVVYKALGCEIGLSVIKFLCRKSPAQTNRMQSQFSISQSLSKVNFEEYFQVQENVL